VILSHQSACAALELADCTLHYRRHIFAVQQLRDGLSPKVVARQFGHSSTPLSTRPTAVSCPMSATTDVTRDARLGDRGARRAPHMHELYSLALELLREYPALTPRRVALLLPRWH
jgi:hypothetical protein